MRTLYVLGLTYLLVSALALWRGPVPVDVQVEVVPWVSDIPAAGPVGPQRSPFYANPGGAGAAPQPVREGPAGWFARVKPNCNTLEVELTLRNDPAPAGLEGTGYEAACLALAGRIDDARARILSLPTGDRYRAAGIVFEIGHPIADMGDDRSAGPIMELVVAFWPNHYMALYHAGAARYALGEYAPAREHLTEFLKYYHEADGWTASANDMLAKIAAR